MRKGNTLVAYGFIDASLTTIPVASFVALPLWTPAGDSITSAKLPHGVCKVQFVMNVSKVVILGQKNGASTYERNCASQGVSIDTMLSPQLVALKALDADITTGKIEVYFYA